MGQSASHVLPTAFMEQSAAHVLPTPPMGFNDWARFQCNINETLFTDTADAFVSRGFRAVGYNRVNIDDCWPEHNRTSNGSLQWNPDIFPKGLIWLANYMKERELDLGIYADAGNETCGGWPGSYGHEKQDLHTFASWGIDYTKIDQCNIQTEQGLTMEQTYKKVFAAWPRAVSTLSKPMIIEEEAPLPFEANDPNNRTDFYTVMDWVHHYANLARISNDIATYGTSDAWGSILNNYGADVLVARYAAPGYFNDPDFLIPDHPELSIDEAKSQFALWSSLSAPLLISADVPGLSDEQVSFLTNKDIIAIDQDSLGLQATLVSQDGTWDVLTKKLSNGDRLLTILNRGNSTGTLSVSLQRIGYPASTPSGTTLTAKNLWTGSSSTVSNNQVTASNVPSHGTAIYRISSSNSAVASSVLPSGMVFNTASMQCLTAQGSITSMSNCSASDAQVWQFNPRSGGTLVSLANATTCLTDTAAMAPCVAGQQSQQWYYTIEGNVINRATKKCLTQGDGSLSGNLAVVTCSDETDEQVWGLPSGSL